MSRGLGDVYKRQLSGDDRITSENHRLSATGIPIKRLSFIVKYTIMILSDKVRNTEIKMAGGLTYGSVNRW